MDNPEIKELTHQQIMDNWNSIFKQQIEEEDIIEIRFKKVINMGARKSQGMLLKNLSEKMKLKNKPFIIHNVPRRIMWFFAKFESGSWVMCRHDG